MKVFYYFRKLFKKMACKVFNRDSTIWMGFGVIEYCEVCGIKQPVYWWADNELYSKVTEQEIVNGDNMAGTPCPRCFTELANTKGLDIRWVPTLITSEK